MPSNTHAGSPNSHLQALLPLMAALYKSEVKSKGELTATNKQKIEWEL